MIRNCKAHRLLLCLLLLFPALLSAARGWAEERRSIDQVVVAELEGPITPISASFILRALDTAERQGDALFVLQLDTPGGLEEAMRDIVKGFLQSSVPVVVWVGPAGARAASAGAIITLASHVAVMAPGTNIGAAHPVAIGGAEIDETMQEKIENDFVAHVRAVADERGRNADWAEEAVLSSVSATADEAVELNVVDFIANNLTELLAEVDGYVLTVRDEQEVILTVADASIERIEMSRKERFLFILSNPTVAYLLGILGAYGILFELWNPGALFPGIVGGICILLAVIGFQIVPISWAGVGLIALALLFFMLEVKVTSFGSLTFAGILSLLLGSIILVDEPSLSLPVFSVILPVVVVTTLFFIGVVGMGLRAQRSRITTGVQGLIGSKAEVRAVLEGGPWSYRVFVNGEYWHASARGVDLQVGEQVRVTAVADGGLHVERTD